MATGYNPGDLFVDVLTVSGDGGSLQLASSFVEASIYESIFTPGITADIKVLDTDDQLGQLKLTGGETVEFSFKPPGGMSADYKFILESLDDLQPTGSQKAKMYVFKCVSEETLHAKTNLVQKSYSSQISEMVQDIHKNYMNSEKPIIVEDTKGMQNILIPSMNPYKAIDMLRRRGVSGQNKSSSFMFFETREGSTPTFKFTTLEKLFSQSPVKEFQQSDAMNHSISNQADTNILSYSVPKQFSALDRIKTGGKRRISTFDFRTHQYKTDDKTPDPTSFTSGGSSSYSSGSFLQKFVDSAKIPPQSFIPVDTSQRAVTNIPDASADQQAYIATMMQNAIKLTVYGDTVLTAGVMIVANIPNKVSTTGPRDVDPLLSGNFLISRIHHEIKTADKRPRYVCNLEVIKGNME
jgi:hypothetical protein